MHFKQTQCTREPILNSPKAKEKKTRIFIVDDHQVLRHGLTQLISHEEDMIIVGEAGNATDAMLSIGKLKPEFIIIDISLEGTSGLELTRNVLTKYPKTLILILSMHDEAVYIERVLRAGAKGYLSKREASMNIIIAIRKILQGNIYVSEAWKDKLMHAFTGRSNTEKISSASNLSDRELEVLQLAGQGHATRQIANELFVSIKTIESHYANIKNKLDLKNSHELIQYAVKWCMSEK